MIITETIQRECCASRDLEPSLPEHRCGGGTASYGGAAVNNGTEDYRYRTCKHCGALWEYRAFCRTDPVEDGFYWKYVKISGE